MTTNDKENQKKYDEELKLRSKINKLLGDFARKEGLEAFAIEIGRNPWYKGDKNTPMFSINIVYKPCYLM